MYVGSPGNMPHPSGDLLSDRIIRLLIIADDLHVDGRRNTEVQDLCDDVSGLEKELHTRETPRQEFPQMPRQVGCWLMLLGIQCNQNLSIARADRPVGTIRLVDAGIRQPNVVENGLQLSLRNFCAQRVLDLIAQTSCLLDPQSGTSANVQPQQPCIHLGKEVLSQE